MAYTMLSLLGPGQGPFALETSSRNSVHRSNKRKRQKETTITVTDLASSIND